MNETLFHGTLDGGHSNAEQDRVLLKKTWGQCYACLGELSMFPVEILKMIFGHLTIPSWTNLSCVSRGTRFSYPFEYDELFLDARSSAAKLTKAIFAVVSDESWDNDGSIIAPGIRINWRHTGVRDADPSFASTFGLLSDYRVEMVGGRITWICRRVRYAGYEWSSDVPDDFSGYNFNIGCITARVRFNALLFIHQDRHRGIMEMLNNGSSLQDVATGIFVAIFEGLSTISIRYGAMDTDLCDSIYSIFD